MCKSMCAVSSLLTCIIMYIALACIIFIVFVLQTIIVILLIDNLQSTLRRPEVRTI